MTDFTGKIILVTGGAKGIGLATAQAFARAGGTVVIADKDADLAARQAAALAAEGLNVSGRTVDLAEPATITALVEGIVADHGRLDIAFNNAGILQKPTPTDSITLDVFDRIMTTNLRGTFLSMQAEIRQMLAQGGGIIVNCASIAALKGEPEMAAYAASKHGMLGYTKAAALEYATRGLRINAVCPGQIDTPMNDWLTDGDRAKTNEMVAETQPIGRIGTPEEIADAVLWLASPGAAFAIGIALPVDGGQSVM